MKILRVWFDESEGDFVSVHWEREREGRKVSELLCMTDSVSKAGRIVLAMRTMMRLDRKSSRPPRIPGWRAEWSVSQHKWQLIPSKARAAAPKKKTKKSSKKKPRGERDSSSGSLRDTDWHDKDARFRGPRGDTW